MSHKEKCIFKEREEKMGNCSTNTKQVSKIVFDKRQCSLIFPQLVKI